MRSRARKRTFRSWYSLYGAVDMKTQHLDDTTASRTRGSTLDDDGVETTVHLWVSLNSYLYNLTYDEIL